MKVFGGSVRPGPVKRLKWYCCLLLFKTNWAVKNVPTDFFAGSYMHDSTFWCFVFLVKRFGFFPFLVYLKFRFAFFKLRLKLKIFILKAINERNEFVDSGHVCKIAQ